jgi:hypothetical protein
MKIITNYLRQKYPDLPSSWSVYSIWKLDGEGEEIAELKGAIARPLQRGKNKGRLTWGKKLDSKRIFLMSMTEYNFAHEQPIENPCHQRQLQLL